MKVLITGGAGFIGLHLSNLLLSQGAEVTLADNLSRGIKDPDLEETLQHPSASFVELDVLDLEAVMKLPKDYDIIVHFAAIIGVQFVLKRPYDVLNLNQVLLHNMIEFGRAQQDLKRFVFASTSEIYAGTLRHGSLTIPTPESSHLVLPPLEEARTSYMLSKIYGEAMCHHSGLPFTIVRPHNVYGPRMGLSHVIPELFQKIYNANEGDDIEVFSPEHTRTFCYVEDAIQLTTHLMTKEEGLNKAFNIGNGSPEIKIIDLVNVLVDVVGKKVNIVRGETTPGSPARRCPNMEYTIKASGYTPSISLEEGAKRTFAWYKPIYDGQKVSAK
tara:strand:+ start:9456 stop:10442 length:987 start_codon:yes stop_codon:yes gene_type:complete